MHGVACIHRCAAAVGPYPMWHNRGVRWNQGNVSGIDPKLVRTDLSQCGFRPLAHGHRASIDHDLARTPNAKEYENYTVCWNQEVSRASLASGGDGNGFVVGTGQMVNECQERDSWCYAFLSVPGTNVTTDRYLTQEEWPQGLRLGIRNSGWLHWPLCQAEQGE